MAVAIETLLSPEDELLLHGRLLRADVTASADLAVTFLAPLINWLVKTNKSSVPEHLCSEAAEDALIALVKSPTSYNPARGQGLYAYMRMSAKGDLQNILRREGRRRRQEISLEAVALLPSAGKYLAVDGNQLRLLEQKERIERTTEGVVEPAHDGLTEAESRALDLMLQGERKTAVLAQALGIADLPKKVQQIAVKRFKDKMNKRMKRGASADGQPS